MSRISPPKPWERPGSSNPVRPAPSSSTNTLSTSTSTTLTTTTTPRPPLRPWERRESRGDYDSFSRSSYGGYGNYGSNYGSSYGGSYGSGYGSSYPGSSSSYGSSYGNNNYGGYGSSYGNSYGYGRDRDNGYNSYGRSNGDYGGYGGRMDPHNKPMGGFSFFSNLQYFVDSFSRFSRLLDANFDAMHGSFFSIARLVEHMGRLNFEVSTLIKTFALFRILQSIISRTFGVFGFLLPWRSSSSSSSNNTLSIRDFQNFAKLPYSPSTSLHPPHTPPSWRTLLVVFLLAFVGLPMLVNKMFLVLSQRSPMEVEWNKEAGGGGEEVVAVHEFRGESNKELSFNKGDKLIVVNKFHPDWWEATMNGQVGVIPANFVSPSSPSSPTPSSNPNQPPTHDGLKLSK